MFRMALRNEEIAANEVRVPTPRRGTALQVTRYGRSQSVILHPDDFTRLLGFEELIDRRSELKPIRYTEAGRRAHFEEDRSAGEAIEDPETLRELFG